MYRYLKLIVAVIVVVASLAVPVSAEMWKYRDRWGMTHVVESLDKVPPEFRDKAEKTGESSRGGIQTVTPVVPAATAPKPVFTPSGKPAASGAAFSFQLASLKCDAEGNEKTGSWLQSRYQFKSDPYYVIVAATWCPHCIRLFETVQNSPRLQRKISGVLVYDDEAKSLDESKGRDRTGIQMKKLVYPEELSKFSIPFFLIKRGTFPKQVTGFPTLLECRPDGCEKIDREAFVAENK